MDRVKKFVSWILIWFLAFSINGALDSEHNSTATIENNHQARNEVPINRNEIGGGLFSNSKQLFLDTLYYLYFISLCDLC